MDIQELANLAATRINNKNKILQLVLPPKKHENRYRFMAGPKSPRGEILGPAANCDGTIVNFSPIDVLAYCIANGAEGTAVMSDGYTVDLKEMLKGW